MIPRCILICALKIVVALSLSAKKSLVSTSSSISDGVLSERKEFACMPLSVVVAVQLR